MALVQNLIFFFEFRHYGSVLLVLVISKYSDSFNFTVLIAAPNVFNVYCYIFCFLDERIKQLWPIEENKQARDYSSHETHVDFPSNEGALITIGFLTLAVFLVKLVLVNISL